MKLAALLLIAASLPAQQLVSLRVTGQIQSVQTTRRNFGRLPNGYRGADWTVTSNSAIAAKIPLARLLQEVHTGPGVSVLSRVSSISVVQDAQGRNPLNTIARVGTGLIGGFATCESTRLCGTGGSWGNVILGAQLSGLLIQSVFPTLPTHALQSMTAVLPDVIALDPLGTQSGMIIVELAGKTPVPALDETVSIAIPK